MIIKMKDPEKAKKIFENYEDTMLLSCYQNVMGTMYADDQESPKSAMLILEQFAFVAGKPNEELLCFTPEKPVPEVILAPENDAWEKLIEKKFGNAASKFTRYAIKKEPDVFNKAHLQKIVDSLPSDFTLVQIDEHWYHECLKEEWSKDFVGSFDSYEHFAKYGLGVLAIDKDGRPVSGAGSYSAYLDGIEIEIDTKEEYQKHGLASCCGAALILKCLEKGKYPSWDAHTPVSVHLAEKLGYHMDHPYIAYYIKPFL